MPGYEASSWQGFGLVKDTPTEIVDLLNAAINSALSDPELKAQLTNLGSAVLQGSPADFKALVVRETEKWGKVIRAADIKPR